MRRILYLLPAALFLVVALYFALALRPGHDPHVLPSALIDKEAPAFDLASLAGPATFTRDGLLGQPIVINFFASWCAPCVVEHPALMALKQEGVTIIGVAYKDPADKAQSAEVLKFFDWAFKNGKAMAAELDYVPLPDALTAEIRSKVWSQIKK